MSRTSRQGGAPARGPDQLPVRRGFSLPDIKCSSFSRSKRPQLRSRRMEELEFQEADVLWPWPDTPPPSPEEDSSYDLLLLLASSSAPEPYEYDAAVTDFSCEPFSEPAASCSASSTTSSEPAPPLSSDWSDDGGGGSFLSAAGLELGDATDEFLEADVLWPDPDTADDDTAGFLWRRRRSRSRSRSRRVDEAAASAAAAVFCGQREGCSGPLVASSPIDIPMAARGAAAAARRRRP